MDSIILSRRSSTSNHTQISSSSCTKLPKRNAKCKMISSMPSSHPSPMVSPITKLQRIQHRLQDRLLPTSTSRLPRKLHQLQVILLGATSSRELHHHQPQPMRPSRRVPSSVSLAEAEATSLMSAPTSEPWSSTSMALMIP